LDQPGTNPESEVAQCHLFCICYTSQHEHSGVASSSLANVSAISTTHINDTALTGQHNNSTSSIASRQSMDVIGRQRQPIVDLDSIDLTTATREPFLDGCRVG